MTAPSIGAASGAPVGANKIMVVQDEFLLRMSTAADLRTRGHHVVEAFSVAEARRALGADDGIALVLFDVTLGGDMTGLELARWIHEHHPTVKLLVTAAIDPLDDDIPILRKPFRPLELFVRIEAMLKA